MASFYHASAWLRTGLAALLLAGSLHTTQAQDLNFSAIATQNLSGTYTDLGATGTVIATANTDDANSTAQNIGFNFSYNGSTFSQFVLNTNGLIRLGSAPPSTAALYYDNNTATTATDPLQSTSNDDINLLMPFNFNLVAGTGAGGTEYRVATTGPGGSRVCTVQWKNVADKAGAGSDAANGQQLANFSFQLKLYEATGTIDFVYGPATAGTAATAVRFANVGLIGSDVGVNQLVLGLKTSVTPWSATVFQNYSYGEVAHNISKDALPDAGRTYRFITRVPCVPAVVSTFPYTESFDGIDPATLPCGATVLDANNDDNSWLVINGQASSQPNSLVYIYSETQPGNDWFFTPGLALKAGMRYQLQFKYRVDDATYPEALEVKAGQAATVAGQTLSLFSNQSITSETYVTTGKEVALITPATDGTYYVGFHAISKPDMDALLVDDISVTAVSALATRGASNGVFSAQVAPVPFGRSLSLTLNTLQAGPLALTLSDALGRPVRTAAANAPTGASTVTLPEMGSLAAGVYFLTVKQGGANQVIRVAHE